MTHGATAAVESLDVPAPAAARPAPRTRPVSVRATGLVAAVVLLVLLVLASIAFGAKVIPLHDVASALLHGGRSDDDLVVTGLRVPRTLLGILVGAALGGAGAIIQAFTRNPLADPGILGVNAGSAFAVTLGVGFLGLTSIGQYLWLALAGAAAATLAVYIIGAASRTGASPVRMTLAGVGLAAVLGGITTGITLSNPTTFQSMLSWSAGSLTGPPLGTVAIIAPFVGAGLIIGAAITRPLNALALGDDLAAALGSRARVTRTAAVIAVTLLSGAATAAAGPIGFVGLMIPHLARWITGPDQRWIFAYTVVLGPCLLLASDVLGRIAMRPAELPVGIVTAFVGAPVLIILVRRTKASAL
ncbi:FecCD family ABC transporter permease [Gryllotalpicola protaetiae]|uniref:Fe(3+)-siderophore ABC transporter permease n=1 Tax=Gryllotalpicola protaetiae TaxID=2419771 RepID=A0A387BZK1_9MICO|nr:iron chelate uptake ABC transporter family permease subunit [Gryllotalpicola protaetiae]AYG03771.1 Fe(3+)-siderophore ABC transporter permease [Gryllotalpicola protaetiae]